MGKGVQSKKRKSVPFVAAPATAAQFEACFCFDVVMGCFAQWLTVPELIRLLRCNKRLYAFVLSHWPVLRECQRLYGGAPQVTKYWIKYATKSGNIRAVEWIMTRALREYVKERPHDSRDDPTGEALVLCIPRALKTAFKLANAPMIEAVLQWRVQNLAPLMKQEGDDARALYHLFNYCGTKEAVSVSLPAAMKAGANHGHTAFVCQFFQTHCANFIFPNDVWRFGTGFNAPTTSMRKPAQQDWIEALINACIIHGDVDSYNYFYPIGAELHNEVGHELAHRHERRFHTLLEQGVSTTFVPILVELVPYRNEWYRPRDWLCWVLSNPNPIMLDYLRNMFPVSLWLQCKDKLQDDYTNKEAAFRDRCTGLLEDNLHKKGLKTLVQLQARLCYLKRILTNPPFSIEWDTFRGYRGNNMLTLNWGK